MSSGRVPIALTIVAGFLVLSVCLGASRDTPAESSALTNALKDFKASLNDRSARLMGFDSLQDLGRAKLGEPISVEAVDLTKLSKHEVDPFSSLVDAHSKIYPVLIDGEPRSSIILQQSDDAWRSQAYGGANMIRNISKVQAKNPGIVYKLVVVRSFDLEFLGFERDQALMLVSLQNDKEYGLELGHEVAATTIFATLAAAITENEELTRRARSKRHR